MGQRSGRSSFSIFTLYVTSCSVSERYRKIHRQQTSQFGIHFLHDHDWTIATPIAWAFQISRGEVSISRTSRQSLFGGQISEYCEPDRWCGYSRLLRWKV